MHFVFSQAYKMPLLSQYAIFISLFSALTMAIPTPPVGSSEKVSEIFATLYTHCQLE